MSASVNPRSGLGTSQAALAVLLAIVLVWVSGLGLGLRPDSLGSATDHGLVGASAERAEFGSLPSGKEAGEGIGAEIGEAEGEEEALAKALPRHAHLDAPAFARIRIHAEQAPPLRSRHRIAAIGARGPPVG